MRYLRLLPLLALAACTSTDPFPLEEATEFSHRLGDHQALAQAEAAERRLDFAAAGRWLDLYAANPEAKLDQAYWFRRAAVAEKGADPAAAVLARQQLLQMHPEDVWLRIDLADDLQQLGRDLEAIDVLRFPFAEVDSQRLAWEASVELHLRLGQGGRAALAAEQLAGSYVGEEHAASARQWWQRASHLHEEAGDLRAATLAMEKALVGVDLAEEEQRALERLRAFELGQPQNAADALGLLQYHPEASHRLAGIRYLSRDRFPNEIDVFEMALQDPEERIVRIAIQELVQRSYRGRVDALLPLLEHEVANVQLAAIRALGHLGTMEQLPTLLEQLKPEDRSLFRAARSALQDLTGEKLSLVGDPDPHQRSELRERWLAWEAPQLPN